MLDGRALGPDCNANVEVHWRLPSDYRLFRHARSYQSGIHVFI